MKAVKQKPFTRTFSLEKATRNRFCLRSIGAPAPNLRPRARRLARRRISPPQSGRLPDRPASPIGATVKLPTNRSLPFALVEASQARSSQSRRTTRKRQATTCFVQKAKKGFGKSPNLFLIFRHNRKRHAQRL